MHYHELTLTFTSNGRDSFRVSAECDLFKRREEEAFEPPWSQEEFAAITEAVQAQTRREVEVARSSEAETSDLKQTLPPSPEEIGGRLFDSVFVGRVGELLERCLVAVGERDSAGLRLRLVFDADESRHHLGWITSLPWELLWAASRRGFLARRRSTPVVRDLAGGQRVRPLTTTLPLRILIVDSGATDLDLRYELRRIRRALGRDRRFKLFHLDHPTLPEIRSALRAERIHVLHFMGHGGFNDRSGKGGIVFVDPQGVRQTILGARFAEQLQDLDELRLVVLNTCKSAMMNGPQGVASALLMGEDPPAVVAMQHPVVDRAAVAFSQSFYGALALGDALDAAVTEARLALSAQTSEWVAPVLYMPSSDGVLFEFEGAEPSPPSRVVAVEDLEITPLHVGLHSIGQFGDLVRSDADRHLLLEDRFEPPTRRHLRAGRTWQADIYEPLSDFLLDVAADNRPLLLDPAVHLSIAFAAGWVLPAKSGLSVTVRQRFQGGSLDWSLDGSPEDPSAQEEPLWLRQEERRLTSDSEDVALVLSVTRNVLQHVETYLAAQDPAPVGRLLHAVVAPEPGPRSVAGGAHVLQLARRLETWIQGRTVGEQQGTLHLFGAAPNALWFALGQLLRGCAVVQLYEHDFDADQPFAAYAPSLRLPPRGANPGAAC